MSKKITVAMADFNTAKAPDTLATIGIGSCVAVCLYDRKNKIGGLAHIMLPCNTENDQTLCGKYADTGIDALILLMSQNGASKNELTAKIIGGANMFAPTQKAATLTVGKNNIKSVKKTLADKGIRIIAEDLGGSNGRAIVYDTETGAVEVTIFSQPVAQIMI